MVAADATPLIAIDALLLDTETTSLDPRSATIVEIAIVPLVGGHLQADAAVRTLVRPKKPIPSDATRIHGIDDAAVAPAPTFSQVWPQFSSRIGDSIMIGHSIGYDLAVLERECSRAGIAWRAPRALDVRLLAEIAAPNLPDYSLESLANWLSVECAKRHTALGDAVTAGRIFIGLVPRLRERGIRTLAEAERVCAGLTTARDAQHRAGWAELGQWTRGEAARTLLKLDSTPYRHRVRDAMTAPAKFIGADTPLGDIVRHMAEERVSSLFVDFGSGAGTPAETGIVTERDVLRRIAAEASQALHVPVGEIASRPLCAVPADVLMFVAVARMNRLKIRHLGVVDPAGKIVGALSARDLLRMRAEGSVALGDEIFTAGDVYDLGRAWARLPEVAAGLLAERLSGLEIAALISHQLAALTARAAVLAERRLEEDGFGPPPCAYVFCVLGSAGRGESLLAMDQDNALIFADGGDGGAHDRWFAALAEHATAILHAVGVPYCKGGVMASNPQWRGPVSAWRERIATWMHRSEPQDLLAVDIFFDMLGVHGDVAMAESLWREAFDAAEGRTAFAKLLAASAGETQTALTLLGRFRTEHGRLDVKKSGLFGLVTVVRALAICHHVVERGTPVRLEGLMALDRSRSDLDALSSAQQIFLDLLVAQQIEDIGRGIPPSNKIEIKRLSQKDRDRLRNALKATHHLDQLVRDLLFDA